MASKVQREKHHTPLVAGTDQIVRADTAPGGGQKVLVLFFRSGGGTKTRISTIQNVGGLVALAWGKKINRVKKASNIGRFLHFIGVRGKNETTTGRDSYCNRRRDEIQVASPVARSTKARKHVTGTEQAVEGNDASPCGVVERVRQRVDLASRV